MKAWLAIAASIWLGCWFTPDQLGQHYFARGEFTEAAIHFHDPLWQGVAWYRAGEFTKAAQAFARRDTPEADYNQGNALLMHGDYEAAIPCYNKALDKRPGWREAEDNRSLAESRAKMTATPGGDLGDQKLGADKIVFDKKKGNNKGQETEVAGGRNLSNQEIQALWLKRVQTRPADFLKAKFSYQQAARTTGGKP